MSVPEDFAQLALRFTDPVLRDPSQHCDSRSVSWSDDMLGDRFQTCFTGAYREPPSAEVRQFPWSRVCQFRENPSDKCPPPPYAGDTEILVVFNTRLGKQGLDIY